ncbi:methyl-accepting chemotaxis protein [Thiomicrorhabdus sp. ZW0627]|uniref:methyl-accepting chemotaxis protein n=1 Tax=Thiomicrorhabdus sp. ZW0627 TaxID=3039774 RepID=UPI002436C11B|nr:methyl-accepting chemotaxis protein [Thiomicrorhabdus sp. ZW0627]MDG6774298.1 methyl-accepting chemotaxis protein [Thiomicrorhabdus sp. ZW0627]
MSKAVNHSGFISNLKMTSKLSIAPVIMILLMIMIGAITYLNSNKIFNAATGVKQTSIPVVNLSTDLLKNTQQAQILITNYLLTHEEKYGKELRLLKERAEWLQEELKTYPLGEKELELLKNIEEANKAYFGLSINKIMPKATNSLEKLNDVTNKLAPEAVLQLTNLRRYSNEVVAKEAALAIQHFNTAQQYTLRYYNTHNISDFRRIDLELLALQDVLGIIESYPLDRRQNGWVKKAYININKIKRSLFRFKMDLETLDTMTDKDLVEITANLIDSSQRLQEEIWSMTRSDTQQIQTSADTLIQTTMIATLASLLLSILIVFYISRKVNAPIEHLKNTIVEVHKSGDFSQRTNIASNDEIGQMASAFDEMLKVQHEAIEEIKSVMHDMAEGVFDNQIQTDLVGDFDEMKQNINRSVIQIQSIFRELNNVNQALSSGDFSNKIELELKGEFERAANAVNRTVEMLNGFVTETNQVMEAVSQGELHNRIDIDLPGQLDNMKQAINETIDTIAQAIDDISRVTQAQSEGDLTRIITTEYNGRFSDLTNSVNQSISGLSKIVQDVQQSTESVSLIVSQVFEGSNNLSGRTQEQAASLEETASALEEMTATIRSNTEAAQDANSMAHNARSKSQASMVVVQRAQESMSQITESSHKIAEIIGLIDSIAFQTNLLALNAAVEAARAGEHGRGFAVVAGEVRNLAQKSAEAANTIKSLIESSVAQVEMGEKQVAETGRTLSDINQAITEVANMIESIAQGSMEQQQGIEQVNTAITSIDQITQENAALAEQTSSASTQMQDESDDMRKTMAFFKVDSQKLLS